MDIAFFYLGLFLSLKYVSFWCTSLGSWLELFYEVNSGFFKANPTFLLLDFDFDMSQFYVFLVSE